ncbi:Transcription factor rlm1 [Pseudogymnoascus australis]
MGRRKIEIKAIKDDRNRSVTFLKRKGGLFKKAHELSVLCSVDVAVIIFGNNKKLYEYSSSDIGEILQRHNFYGGANEHKGPSDFNGKRDGDEDEDDDGSVMDEGHPPEGPMMPPHFQSQPAFQHMRQAPSASPPIQNGAHFQNIQRQHTPQPPQLGSRPASRNAPHRVNSNLAQQHMQQGPQPSPPMNGYSYMPQPGMYSQQQHGQNMPPHGQNMPPHSQPPPQQQQPSYQYQGPPPPSHQLQQVYMEEQRRSSMPPVFPKQERQESGPMNTPPQPQQQIPSQQQQQQHHQQQQQQQQQQQPQHQLAPPPPQQRHPSPQQHHQPPPQTQPSHTGQMLEPKRMSVKSRSIFTPIDESRSILSQHWISSTSAPESTRGEPALTNRASSSSLDSRNGTMKSPPPHTHPPIKPPPSDKFTPPAGPPSRTNSVQLSGKRPRLTVQIPDEPSDGGEGTGASTNSPRESNDTGSHPSRARTDTSHSSGVVLPPPSPSASALLSAGASGPPNPFARPHPPNQGGGPPGGGRGGGGNEIETPVSALPSRFMTNELLPSPSSFYPEWNFRGGDGNTLPSPLNFATPVVGSGPSFLHDTGPGVGKRKSPEEEGGGGGEAKRVKHEP